MRRHKGTFGRRRIADLAVLLVLAGLSALYCYDAVSASTHIYNLILVLPLTALVIAICLAQFVVILREEAPPAEPAGRAADAGPVMLLFAAYVLSLNWLGFDVGTCLFIAAFLYLQGERRWPWLIGYSVAFAFIVTLFFSAMLPYPMPTLVPGLAQTGGPL